MSTCIGEPVSYPRLERYGLGELPADESQRVAAHLASCPLCRECFERLQADTRVLDLSAVHAVAKMGAPAGRAPARRERPARWLAWSGGLLGASLALGLFLMSALPGTRHDHAQRQSSAELVKGESLALEVVRVDAQGRQREPSGFAAGDRFKLLLTCPPSLAGNWRVLAFQAGEVFEPVTQQLLRCGNRAAVGGAWALDGEAPVELCVVRADGVSAAVIDAARSPQALPEPNLCVRLAPQ